MLLSVEEYLTHYPRFASVPPAQIAKALDRAERNCPFYAWGSDQEEGVKLYAAHLLECEWQQTMQTAGAATAIAKGQSAPNPAAIDFLDRSIYGQQYRALRDTLGTTTGFVI